MGLQPAETVQALSQWTAGLTSAQYDNRCPAMEFILNVGSRGERRDGYRYGAAGQRDHTAVSGVSLRRLSAFAVPALFSKVQPTRPVLHRSRAVACGGWYRPWRAR